MRVGRCRLVAVDAEIALDRFRVWRADREDPVGPQQFLALLHHRGRMIQVFENLRSDDAVEDPGTEGKPGGVRTDQQGGRGMPFLDFPEIDKSGIEGNNGRSAGGERRLQPTVPTSEVKDHRSPDVPQGIDHRLVQSAGSVAIRTGIRCKIIELLGVFLVMLDWSREFHRENNLFRFEAISKNRLPRPILCHAGNNQLASMKLISAKLQARNKVVLHFDGAPAHLLPDQISFTPARRILALEQLEDTCVVLTDDCDITRNYMILVRGYGYLPVLPDEVFDEYCSEKPLGYHVENGRSVLRLFAPRATVVHARFFSDLEDEIGTLYELQRDEQGVWELSIERNERDRYYCYHVGGPQGSGDVFNERIPVADPYATLVVSRNSYRHEARAVIRPETEPFDWEGDAPVAIDPRDLVLYEMHVRDMTVHPSSGVDADLRGSYAGLTQPGVRGGLEHVKRLGVNAVELMPAQHFASCEPPYQQPTPEGYFNTWNPYARNHWGYMTSYFFAPEPTYATGSRDDPGAWNDTRGRQVDEFKRMVKSFHREGISLILDVVYNHTSQYDYQPLRYIDKKYYYHVDAQGKRRGASGCGNDVHTARAMSRRLIIDSVLYWMREYHIDGFRFDLAAMIDTETYEELIRRAKEVNPSVILIAEPWGGGHYDLKRFSQLGMSAWNDIFRDGVRGHNPHNAHGYLFGTWGSKSSEDFGTWIFGCPADKGGPFVDPGHSVNYLSAHDGYTIGDFIRIACGRVSGHTEVRNIADHVRLSDRERRINKLAALMLCVSQGALMLEQGQEFARAKVIADRRLPGTTPFMIDHNSYEKDDETNWMNYTHADWNGDLVAYYTGLIGIRKEYAALRRASRKAYRFLVPNGPIAGGFIIDEQQPGSPVIAVLINANAHQACRYQIPPGTWNVLANADTAGRKPLSIVREEAITIPPESGMILVKGISPPGAFPPPNDHL